MSLKIFIIILFLFPFVFTSVSHADQQVLKRIKKKEDTVRILSGRYTEKEAAKKATSLKDKHLNRDLELLEKNMERKVDNKAFGDICKRYIDLTKQYGEADRAINFFDSLAKRHPQSPNVLSVSGVKTYGQREIKAKTGFNQEVSYGT